MDHPISASLSLIGFIHFNKMPASRFSVLNVADPLSVLSFSYLNLTWLNAQRYTERQQSLRWFITQQKQTQLKAGEDKRTKDTRQQTGLNGEISFTMQYDSTVLQVSRLLHIQLPFFKMALCLLQLMHQVVLEGYLVIWPIPQQGDYTPHPLSSSNNPGYTRDRLYAVLEARSNHKWKYYHFD